MVLLLSQTNPLCTLLLSLFKIYFIIYLCLDLASDSFPVGFLPHTSFQICHACMHAYIRTHTHTHARTHKHTHMHTHTHTLIHIHTHTHSYTHTHTHTNTHSYTHTHMYYYIPWIHKCVTKTVGCGTSHKYTNIHNLYTVRYCKHFK
jgi:hypothetical protein